MFRLACLTSAALLSLSPALHAQSTDTSKDAPLINFVLWNNGPGQSFDLLLWQRLIAKNFRDGITVTASSETGLDRIRETVQAAGRGGTPETVVVLTTTELDMTEAEFETALNNVEAKQDEIEAVRGGHFLLKSPMCRVVQSVMKPTDYAPIHFFYTTPAGRADCYAQAIDLFYSRDQSGTAVDETAALAQDAMPAPSSMGWMFFHPDGPDKGKRRVSQVFAPGEPIMFQTTLDYVRKKGAGAPGASFAVQLDLEIKNQASGKSTRVDGLTTFTGTASHRVPIDANYFRNWFRAGIDLKDPGTYEITYSFTDLNAPEDRNGPAQITTEVEIRE